MISRGGSQPQISRFLYIGPTLNVDQNLVFRQKKKKKNYKYHNLTRFLAYKSGKLLC